MGEWLIPLGEGVVLAMLGLPILTWAARQPDGADPSRRQSAAVGALALGALLLAIPPLARVLPHPTLPVHLPALDPVSTGVIQTAPALERLAVGFAVLKTVGAIWLLLVALGVAAAIRRALVLRGVRLRSRLAPNALVLQAVELARESGTLPPWVLLSDEAAVPFIAGVLRPFVIIPSALLETLNPTQVATLIAHELCHLQRSDPTWAFAVGVLRVLFWPHPSAAALVARWAQAREEAVDAHVARPDPAGYARLLVDVAEHTTFGPREAALVSIRSSSLERRILMLTRPRSSRPRSLVLAAGCALALGALGLFAGVAQAQPGGSVIHLRVGETAAIFFQHGFSRVAIGDPSVADVRAGGDDSVKVTGVAAGTTALRVWAPGTEPILSTVEVDP